MFKFKTLFFVFLLRKETFFQEFCEHFLNEFSSFIKSKLLINKTTEYVNNLDNLNLVKLYYGGLVLSLSKFSIHTHAFKK